MNYFTLSDEKKWFFLLHLNNLGILVEDGVESILGPQIGFQCWPLNGDKHVLIKLCVIILSKKSDETRKPPKPNDLVLGED